MKRISLILFAFILLASACKKKETPAPTVPFTPAQAFFPLKTGNFWVYQRADSSGFIAIDSLKVLSDTVMNGITYYYLTDAIFEGIAQGYYGDSAGYILYPGDAKLLLTNQANDTLGVSSNNVYTAVERTGKADTTINVTAGAFAAIQVIDNVYYNNPTTNAIPPPKFSYYSNGVGLIYATNYFEYGTAVITMQLISYHISP